MKRGKKIGILAGVFCCISLAAFGVSRYEEQKEIIKNSDEIILEVAGEEVNTFFWECGTGSFAFHKDENGTWLYDTDENFPVDEEKIGELLEQFREFGVSFVIEEVEDWEQYGLDSPVCTIRMETEGETYEILLGDYSAMDSERYVSVGDGNAYLVKTDPLEQFEVEIQDMIRHDEIPELNGVKQIQFSGEEAGQIIYEEDSPDTYYEEDVYFMEQEDGKKPLDTSRVEEWLDVIRNLNPKDYVTYNASEEDLAQYGLDTPILSVSVEYTATDDEEEELTENFVLHIGRNPEEQEAEDAETNAEDGEGESEEEVTAYARVGESDIIYQISSNQYKELMDRDYDSLRHQEMFWGDFSKMYQLDISLEGETYTITSELEEEDRVYYYQEEELEMAGLRSTIGGIKAGSFTDEEVSQSQKEEIGLTIYLDDENFPEVRIQLYRYDGDDCLAVVDGKATAFVERACVVDLIEAVNRIVL